MPAQWATSKDVAERAQVSRAAVSTVLNGARSNIRVSADTRDRILRAAAELDYTPNPVAQHLRMQRSGVVALATPSFSDGLYERTVPYQLSHHIMRTAVERGCQLIETALPPPAAPGEQESLRLFGERRVDGVILGWPESKEQVRQLARFGLPVVQVMKPQPARGTSTITVDPSNGFHAAVKHLTELGHERIAYIGSSNPHPVERTRVACFKRALAEHGVGLRRDHLQLSANFSIQEGHRLAERLLASNAPPTALLAGDGLVLGALRALYDARLHVPTDVSVVGFDDMLAASLYPPLASIGQPIAEVAERAVSFIDERVTGDPAAKPVEVVMPTHFTVRSSTAPPPTRR